MPNQIGQLLEQYTLNHPQEVLLVQAEIDGELDEIAIFKGFSSSLMRPTAFDPDIPVIPDHAKIIKIDRLASPYTPTNPHYIQQNVTWHDFQALLLDTTE
jgi:hypothetical protein